MVPTSALVAIAPKLLISWVFEKSLDQVRDQGVAQGVVLWKVLQIHRFDNTKVLKAVDLGGFDNPKIIYGAR